jgi:hypothetical protein
VNTFELEIWYDEGKACSFYTVRYSTDNDDNSSETDKFFDKYADPEHPFENEAFQLFSLITKSIGDKYGASDDFFDRTENAAQALPPKPKIRVQEIKILGTNFPLRLFCYRISNEIVILFNGGIKDAGTAQESEDLSMKFYEAQNFVKRIERALRDEMIIVTNDDSRHLQSFDGSDNMIL